MPLTLANDPGLRHPRLCCDCREPLMSHFTTRKVRCPACRAAWRRERYKRRAAERKAGIEPLRTSLRSRRELEGEAFAADLDPAYDPPLDERPTRVPPGRPRIEVYRARLFAGLQLFHPADLNDQPAIESMSRVAGRHNGRRDAGPTVTEVLIEED